MWQSNKIDYGSKMAQYKFSLGGRNHFSNKPSDYLPWFDSRISVQCSYFLSQTTFLCTTIQAGSSCFLSQFLQYIPPCVSAISVSWPLIGPFWQIAKILTNHRPCYNIFPPVSPLYLCPGLWLVHSDRLPRYWPMTGLVTIYSPLCLRCIGARSGQIRDYLEIVSTRWE